MTRPEQETTAERLAAWLEGLGLADHLAAAGLPTLTRDSAGRAEWTDPVTGDALSGDQLADLDALLHQEGTDPAHAVPVALVQVARQARLRAALLDGAWHTYESLAALRGADVETTRFAVHKAGGSGELLVVSTQDGRVVVPAFQLAPTGDVRRELVAVLRPLLAARMDPWRVWIWLTQPAALLGGLVPEQAAADPDEVDVVVRAAVVLAARVA